MIFESEDNDNMVTPGRAAHAERQALADEAAKSAKNEALWRWTQHQMKEEAEAKALCLETALKKLHMGLISPDQFCSEAKLPFGIHNEDHFAKFAPPVSLETVLQKIKVGLISAEEGASELGYDEWHDTALLNAWIGGPDW